MSSPRMQLFQSGVGLCVVVALGAATAVAQTTTNITVTVNGVATAPGTFNSANIFQATCEGTENISNTAGDPAIFRLQWTPRANDTIFWDTSADCNTGNTVTDDGGQVISGNDVSGSITIDPPGSASVASYGVGAGNVEINMRTVLNEALPVIDGNIFDGGNACSPPEKGTLYVCVTQTETSFSGISQVQTTLAWYMAVNYDTFSPEAPSGVIGQSGDSNVTIAWTFSDSNFPPAQISFNVYYQVDPNNLVPETNGTCSPGGATSGDGGDGASGRIIPGIRIGGGCGDAGVDDAGDAGTCPDAGPPGVNTVGVCGGCFADSDCGGNNACIVDSFGNTYCGSSCSPTDDLDGGENFACPAGFACAAAPDVNGIRSYQCMPSNGPCIPDTLICGSCTSNSMCPSGQCITADGGVSYCAVLCSASGVNADGTGSCLGATVCEQFDGGSFVNSLCGLPSYDCYDPTSLAVIFDGGDQLGVDAGTGAPDAGSGGSGIDVTGWQKSQFAGTLSSAQIGGLTNGTCYDFVVQTQVQDGTLGLISSEVVLAPVRNYDFWRLYQQDQNGVDAGGLHCQAAGGSVGILAVMAAYIGLRRRRSPGPRR